MQLLNTLSNPRVSDLLQHGKIGVIPTDTLYGLVCSASNETAVSRLYTLKQREAKPGTLVAASLDQLVDLGIKRRYLLPVAHFWPGAVSIVIPCGPELKHMHLGMGTLAMRVVAGPLAELLHTTGPLLTSSANKPGEPPADTAQAAQAVFGDAVDFYVDGGDVSGRKPSTVIRIIDDAVEVLREGAVILSEKGEITNQY